MSDITQRAFFVDDGFLAKYSKKKFVRKTSDTKKPRVIGNKISRIQDLTCDDCSFKTQCQSPMMKPFGKNKKGIVIVGDFPTVNDDKEGRLTNKALSRSLQSLGIDLYNDCLFLYGVQCKPPSGMTSTKLQLAMRCCSKRLQSQLNDIGQAKLIITFGALAAKAILNHSFDVSETLIRGFSFPSQKYNCWIGCCNSYTSVRTDELFNLMTDDIARALQFYNKKIPSILPRDKVYALTDFDKASIFLEELNKLEQPLFFDFETNSLSPWSEDPRILCVSFAITPDEGWWIPLQHGSYWNEKELSKLKYQIANVLSNPNIPKVIQNAAFEVKWTKEYFKVDVANILNDTMITAHVLDERKKVTSQEFQVFRLTGDMYKNEVNRSALDTESESSLITYSGLDSMYNALSHNDQMQKLNENSDLRNAAEFFCSRVHTLIRAEQRGMALDFELLEKQEKETQDILNTCSDFFKSNLYISQVEKIKGKSSFNPGSSKDLQILFYDVMKLKPPPWKTKTGNFPCDKAAIEFLSDSVTDSASKELFQYLRFYSIYSTKLRTFLQGFKKLVHDDGLLHPEFLVHWVETYRSSSKNPNFQNLPKRNDEQADFRKLIIPHLGSYIIEVDATGSEVAVIAMLSKDSILTQQIIDGADIHRYWAAKLYSISEEKVTKLQRYNAKNKFIFPEFYGSWFAAVANDIGLPIDHVKKIEADFWKMYRDVKIWQESTLDFYDNNGYITMPLGFRRHEPLSKNQILNSAVQGTSFHMLLESMYRADLDMMERGFQSGIVAEVHDSIVSDTAENEKDEVINILVHRMTEKQWDWQGDVPRRCEIMIGPNWGEMKEIVISN